ncbi:VOC family protein [Streptomyces sp. NPDC055036]
MVVLDAECERLVGLGAARLRRDGPAPPTSAGYIVMADPEGSELCLD